MKLISVTTITNVKFFFLYCIYLNLKYQLSELDNVTNLNVINVMASNDYEDKKIGTNYCFFGFSTQCTHFVLSY